MTWFLSTWGRPVTPRVVPEFVLWYREPAAGLMLRGGAGIGPDREGVTVKLSARECAPARLAWPLIGLIICASVAGCARTRPGRRPAAEPPLLGVEAGAGGYPNGIGIARAESGHTPKEKARGDARAAPTTEPAPLAEPIERTSAARREGPIEVTLLPPLPALPGAPNRPARSRTAPKPVAPPAPTAESLLADAKLRLAGMSTYQVHLTRQERIGETLHPAEDVLLSIRREPRAVRLEWVDGPHKGREVLYAAGGPMHINDPHGLMPRLTLAPDSPLVVRTSRHPITEAGFDSLLVGLDEGVAARGPDRARYLGMEAPEGLNRPCHKLVRTTPDGQVRTLYLDPQTHLPALVTLLAADGSLLESYRFADLKPERTELATATAFDPDARWGAAPGFLSRLAGHPSDGGSMQR